MDNMLKNFSNYALDSQANIIATPAGSETGLGKKVSRQREEIDSLLGNIIRGCFSHFLSQTLGDERAEYNKNIFTNSLGMILLGKSNLGFNINKKAMDSGSLSFPVLKEQNGEKFTADYLSDSITYGGKKILKNRSIALFLCESQSIATPKYRFIDEITISEITGEAELECLYTKFDAENNKVILARDIRRKVTDIIGIPHQHFCRQDMLSLIEKASLADGYDEKKANSLAKEYENIATRN